MLLVPFAFAGSLTIQGDAARVNEAALRADVAPYAFDTVVLIDTTKPTLAGLSADAAALKTSEHVLVIAVDPEDRHTDVVFGSGVGVAAGDFDDVREAGNDAFKAGKWTDGVAAIAASAASPTHWAALERTATTYALWAIIGGIAILSFATRGRGGRFGRSPPGGGYAGDWESGGGGSDVGGGDSGHSGGSW